MIVACNGPENKDANNSSSLWNNDDSSDTWDYPKNEEWTGYFRNSKLNKDLIIDSVCHAVDSLGEFEPVNRIYSSDQVSGLYYCESMFLRKHKSGGSIEAGFLYSYPIEGDSVMVNITWFSLGGPEQVVSIFSYQHNDTINFIHDKWVVVISQDENQGYYSDIFFEDCGMHECGMVKLFGRSPVYDQYFGAVASVGDFKTKFPYYYKIQKFKKFFENIGMMKIAAFDAYFDVWEKQKLLNE